MPLISLSSAQDKPSPSEDHNDLGTGPLLSAKPFWQLPTWQLAGITAAIGTLAFYLPLVAALQSGNAHWPAFMLTHDQQIAYFPAFVEGYRRFWHGGLPGLDFFTEDGASIFAYRPNFSPFYPPYLLAYLLVDCSNLRTGMLAFVAIHVVHQFIGMYFTAVFVCRYLLLPGGAAV